MNHKRKRPKNSRAGCLMCKAHKANGCGSNKLGHYGFGKLRRVAASGSDLKEFFRG